MFKKKIYEKLDKMSGDLRDITNRTISINNQQYSVNRAYDESISQVLKNNETVAKIIESQQAVISQLTNILCGKYEHGLFVMTNDDGTPVVIKDGKIITGDKVSSFNVDWSYGEAITLSVDYME